MNLIYSATPLLFISFVEPLQIMKVVLLFVVCLWAYLPCTIQQFPTNAEELSMMAVEGLSRNIEVTCGFNEDLGTVFWVINDIIYDLNTNVFSCFERDGLYTLRIPIVQLCLNDTSFQCLSSTIHPPGRVTRIYVIKNPSNQTSNGCDCVELESSEQLGSDCYEPEYDKLDINTQTLIIHEENFTTFEFFTALTCNESNIYLEVYNENTQTNISLLCCDANISSSKILRDGNTITSILQLVSSMDCKNSSKNYTINNIPTTQNIINGNDSVCIPFPVSTTICNRNTHEEHNIFLVLSSNCFSITLNQFDGNFNRHHGCMNWDVCNYNLIINSTSEQVCFYDWNPQLTNTVVHFMCTTHNQDSSPIYNLLYSHEIIADSSMYRTSSVETVTSSANTADRTPTTVTFISSTSTRNNTQNSFSTSSSNSTSMPAHASVTVIVVATVVPIVIGVIIVIVVSIVLWRTCKRSKTYSVTADPNENL